MHVCADVTYPIKINLKLFWVKTLMTPAQLQIAVVVRPAAGEHPNELARTMAPHPLIHQELPYSPEYFVYNRRLAAGRMTNYTPDEVYWAVRTNVIMRHTAELPVDVRGPDAETLLNRVFTRDVAKTRIGRCSSLTVVVSYDSSE